MKELIKLSFSHLLTRIAVFTGIFLQLVTGIQAAPQFMDFFTATPIIGSLSSTCWGAATVGPRDQSNGLEDRTISRYCYWDGAILKGPDGIYHMFASRWAQSAGHNGWFGSQAVHATSNNLFGPYTDQGLVWPNDANGQGHNVLALILNDGRYAVYCSETRRPTIVYVSSNLNGPWTRLGTVSVTGPSASGFTHSNVFIMLRPDGRYGIISRDALVGVADNILGPYNITGTNIYSQAAGMPTGNIEDPCMWYSGGVYHVVANKWDTRKAYHLTSPDGIRNWKLDAGYAYDPTANFVRYTNGTVNHWNKLERFNVYIENGHIAAVMLSAIDVAKDAELGNDQHGSKVIVVPFDGVRFDGGSTASPTPTPTPSPTPTPLQEPIWTGGPYALNGTSDYVDVPDGITAGLSDFSIACWVKLNTVTDWVRIFDFGGDSNIFMMLTPRSATTGLPYFAITTTGNAGEQGINSSSALPVGSWQHLAVVKSGNTGILYINGEEVGTNTAMTLRPMDLGDTANNYLGRSQWSHDPYLDAGIDEFKIYNRALTAQEVTTLGEYPPDTGLKGDVNGDGSVTIIDAMLIAQYVSGLNPVGFITARADVNGDGTTNINDALLVARYAAGLITSL